jgi:septum site-determining protein MinD
MGGSVYAFAGGKGGVGKTTVTANVAIALQENGYDVAVVDGDVGMTNLGKLFDIDAEQGVHQVLAGEATVEEICIARPNGLTLVPGEADIESTGNADPANLKRILDPLAETHDIVLLDTGAGINHQNFVAYGRSDAVALVTTPTKVSLTNLQKTEEMVHHVDGTVAGMVLTRTRTDSDLPDPADIVEKLDTDLLAAVPEYDDPDATEPRTLHAPETPAGEEYQRLANALAIYHKTGDSAAAATEIERDDEEDDTDREQATTETTSSGGLFARLASAISLS